ncbi:hypothetical protein HU200_041667 [Digitaria exilis]|uniref:Uncharacterized protein n=1 Tax=Digitaria exilis TaxID=1010633 RepID=A0A835BFB0_9POAL|nr:hypothetical protein HU200_041667 [Digitaria exilis]
MSSKIMITYKRKRVTSQDHTADDTVVDSSPAASSNVVASNLPPKFEAHAENTIANEDNFVRNLSLFLVLRVKKKINLDEPADENCSPGNDIQCSTLTHSQPSSSTNDTPLLKCSAENPLDTEDKDKVATVRCTGLSTQDERTPEQKNSHIVKSSVQHMVPQIAEGGNQNMTLEDDGTPVSKFTCVQEVTEQDARVGDSSKTSLITVEAPKGIHVQGEGHAIEQTRSVQSPRQNDLVGSAQKQMSQPIERMFFTKEKDTIHGKQQQYEGPTMHTSFSNFFDLTRPWRYGVNNWNAMLRDTRLRFSNSRMPDDLAKQWNKEQKKLLTSGLGPAPPLHVTEDYLGRASCSGCSQSPFLGTQMDLSLGDVYRCHTRASDRVSITYQVWVY